MQPTRGVQPNSKPDQLEQPAWTRIRNRQNRPLRRSVTGFHTQDPTPAGRVAGFLFQNLSHPTRPMLYTNLAIFGEIQARFGEIRQDLRRSRLISAIFGVDLLGFWRFQQIFWRFRWWFGVFSLRSREFCKNQVTIWCFFA